MRPRAKNRRNRNVKRFTYVAVAVPASSPSASPALASLKHVRSRSRKLRNRNAKRFTHAITVVVPRRLPARVAALASLN